MKLRLNSDQVMWKVIKSLWNKEKWEEGVESVHLGGGYSTEVRYIKNEDMDTKVRMFYTSDKVAIYPIKNSSNQYLKSSFILSILFKIIYWKRMSNLPLVLSAFPYIFYTMLIIPTLLLYLVYITPISGHFKRKSMEFEVEKSYFREERLRKILGDDK